MKNSSLPCWRSEHRSERPRSRCSCCTQLSARSMATPSLLAATDSLARDQRECAFAAERVLCRPPTGDSCLGCEATVAEARTRRSGQQWYIDRGRSDLCSERQNGRCGRFSIVQGVQHPRVRVLRPRSSPWAGATTHCQLDQPASHKYLTTGSCTKKYWSAGLIYSRRLYLVEPVLGGGSGVRVCARALFFFRHSWRFPD